MSLLHVVPGPDQHGVVLHGAAMVREGDELLRAPLLREIDPGALAGRTVVVQVTDRTLTEVPDEALAAWRRATTGAARVTVVLHDLPQASDGRHRHRRTRLYAALAAASDDVVVQSRHERLLLAAALRWAEPARAEAVLRRTHVVPLPVERSIPRPAGAGGVAEGALVVATLGFVYPGKGLEEVVDATALAARDPRLAGREVRVLNLGRASDGHEDLLDELAGRAERQGIAWSTTGWLEETELQELLGSVAVPVAAHRHLSASGSIGSWLGAGRRPLVTTSRYVAEQAERLPGALTLVPGETVTALAGAIADALADPATTHLGPEVRLGPSTGEAAAALGEIADQPAVSVVVPYYRDQELLDLVVDRLAAQQGVAGGLELVVADDGSPEPPRVPAAPHGALGRITVVRQADDGFRAAAARNLGAASARGRVLLFLDGDTVPEEGYAAALQRVCLTSPTLAVGRRRHAHLRGVGAWPPADPLPEPAWLADGYAWTDDLRRADDASFRWVISAVLGVSRPVWESTGGFEESFRAYGGEDWELTWRAWLAGADLRHVPEAVAWHDGPEAGARETPAELAETKNAETAQLAPLLPHPLVRGRGWVHEQPDLVCVLEADGWSGPQLTVVVESLLRLGDVGVWVRGGPLTGPAGAPAQQGSVLDPRVRHGCPPQQVLVRARAVLTVTAPAAVLRLPIDPWPGEVTGVVEGAAADGELTEDRASGVHLRAVRHTGRAVLHGEEPPAGWLLADRVEPVPEGVVLERWRQAHP